MQISGFMLSICMVTAISLHVTSGTEIPSVGFDTPNFLHRREILAGKKSTLSITTYAEDNCAGAPMPHPNTQYNYNYPAIINSYYLSRGLDPSEQLDFSKYGTGTANPSCGTFINAAPNGQHPGCHSQAIAACFRFWHHWSDLQTSNCSLKAEGHSRARGVLFHGLLIVCVKRVEYGVWSWQSQLEVHGTHHIQYS